MIKTKRTHQLAAALTTGMLLGRGLLLLPPVTFDDVGKNVISSSGALPQMIETVAYVGGIGLGVAGVFKLKQHVDNPGQTPMKDGLVRLGAGGGLLALPYMTSAMMGSIDNAANGGQSAQDATMRPVTNVGG